MQFWIIQGLNSLSLGGLLFLLSSGFSLIFGLMRLANLTHGAFFMLGTYFGATTLRAYSGLNIWVTALGAGLAVAALARRVAPSDTVDLGARLGLPPLSSREVVLYSKLSDARARRALRTLSAAFAANAA